MPALAAIPTTQQVANGGGVAPIIRLTHANTDETGSQVPTGETHPLPTTTRAATTGGLSASKTVSAASTNATVVKASAGQVYSVHASNINGAVRYLKLYDKATAPTVGTDVPVATYLLPIGGSFTLDITAGLAFAAGISFALTTGVADTDTGAVAANEHVVNIGFK